MMLKITGNTARMARFAVVLSVWGLSAAAWAADEGRVLWSTPSQVRSVGSVERAALPEPVVGPDFVAWSTGRAIHAVRLDDGTPLFDAGRPSQGTEVISMPLVLPGIVPPTEARLSKPCHHGGRLFASVIAPARVGDGAARLVAVDCSRAGGGRVEWSAGLPPRSVAFNGPPWVDGERLSVIVVGDGPRMPRRLARFDVFDGRHLETLSMTDADRPPESPGWRVAAGRGRFVIATDRTIECRQDDEARP